MPILVRGVVGQIKWHGAYSSPDYGYMAAAVNGFAVSYNKESGEWWLQGLIVACDAFKITQRPLTFIVPTKEGAMRWRLRSLEWTEGQSGGMGRIQAALDPPDGWAEMSSVARQQDIPNPEAQVLNAWWNK